MILSAILVLIMAFGYSMFLDAVLPDFLKVSVLPIALAMLLLVGLFGGKHSALEFFRKTLIYTFPLWVFGFAQYLIIHSPIMVLLPHDNSDVIVLVTAPALVSVGGWLFWRFARYQDVARDAGVLLSLVVHLMTISSVIINGDMTRTVGMFSAGSLGLTLVLVSTVYDTAMSTYAQRIAMGMAAIAVALGLSLMVVSQKASTRIDRIHTKASEIEAKLKDGKLGAEARASLTNELKNLGHIAAKNGAPITPVDTQKREADGQAVPEQAPFAGYTRNVMDARDDYNVMEHINGKQQTTLQEITKKENNDGAYSATPQQKLEAAQINASAPALSNINQLP